VFVLIDFITDWVFEMLEMLSVMTAFSDCIQGMFMIVMLMVVVRALQ
jgi:hypothetical protein